jgi:hypothetical protein
VGVEQPDATILQDVFPQGTVTTKRCFDVSGCHFTQWVTIVASAEARSVRQWEQDAVALRKAVGIPRGDPTVRMEAVPAGCELHAVGLWEEDLRKLVNRSEFRLESIRVLLK